MLVSGGLLLIHRVVVGCRYSRFQSVFASGFFEVSSFFC